MFGYNSIVSSLLIDSERKSLSSLLASLGLSFEDGADYTALVEEPDGGLVATASLFGNVIRMVAVKPTHQELGLSAVAISSLMEISRSKGIIHLFIYTKPEMADSFKALGFRVIAETDSVSLLEFGEPDINSYRKYLELNRFSVKSRRVGAIVVNCDPFTLGHRYIIEKASGLCDLLYVIAVETDLSTFSFKDRHLMISDGISDIENVKILKSGEYAVSAATFPTYFLKGRGVAEAAEQQARLDLNLFAQLFVPELSVNIRFVGTERNSPVTAIYNKAMFELLPRIGVEVCEIERSVTLSGAVISASEVRRKIKAHDLDDITDFLPMSTIDILREKKHM